jgi:uncharacterized membrane protein YfcA
MAITGVAGAVGGTFGLKALDHRWLALALAATIVLYLVVRFTKPDFAVPVRVSRIASPPVGLAAGVLQGATGISGPLLTMYLHSLRLSREAFVASIATMFLVLASVQTVTLIVLGLYDAPRVGQSLMALIPIAIMMAVASRYARQLSTKLFDRWIIVLLAVFAIRLIYEGLMG